MSLPLSAWRRHLAIRHLHSGGVMAYPTEGVYGLGCDPWNFDAVAKILWLKKRTPTKGLILIASEFIQLLPFIRLPPKNRLKAMLKTWPGPVTWLVPASPNSPSWIRGSHSTIAVRVTAHPTASALCRSYGGAMVSTSANQSGRPPARSTQQVHLYFPEASLLVIPGKLGGLRQPTPILDALTGEERRPG